MSVGSTSATSALINRRAGIRLASAAAAAVLAGAIFLPGTAQAADWIEVGGSHYDAGEVTVASKDGTWSWDGGDNLDLNGYNGGSISAGGTLNINATGENTIEAETETETRYGYDEENDEDYEYEYSSAQGISVEDIFKRDENNNPIDAEDNTEWQYYETADETAPAFQPVVLKHGNLNIYGPGTIFIKMKGTNLDEATGIFAGGTLTIDGAAVNVTLQNVVNDDGRQVGVKAESMTMRNGANVNVTSTSESAYAAGILLDAGTGEATSLIDDSALTVTATYDAISADAYGYWDEEDEKWVQVGTANLTINDSEVSATSTDGTYAIYARGTLAINNSDVDAVANKTEWFAVGARMITLSQESGDVVITNIGSDDDPWYVLTTSAFDPESGDWEPQTKVSLRRTGETPKHLRATTAATASATKGGLAQTGDPFNPALPLGMAAGAVAMLGAAKHLRRREDEE